MPLFDLSQQPTRTIFAGVTVTTAWGDQIMLSFVQFAYADALVPTHQHPHEQAGLCLEGEFELTIGDETHHVRPGDSYLIPSNALHSARALGGPCRTLDIFHPVREDYK
jgi:quercetin dioxygenase-like cupin family protein